MTKTKEALAVLKDLAKNIPQDPWHWTTAEGIKVTLSYDPKEPNLPVIHSSHLFHVLKLHYNALIKSGVIDAELVQYSIFSRNFRPEYIKANLNKVAYNMVRMIIELAGREDLEVHHKMYFDQIVDGLYNFFKNKPSASSNKTLQPSTTCSGTHYLEN